MKRPPLTFDVARPTATLAVVALLAVAGCAGLGIGGGSSSGPASDLESATPIYETPLESDAVLDGHVDAVRAADNYTLDLRVAYGGEGETTNPTEYTVRANAASGAAYAIIKQPSQTLQSYRFENGTAYRRTVSDGDTTYHEWSDRAKNGTAWARTGLRLPLAFFEYTYAGAKSVDGDRVHVYQADGGAALDTSVQQLEYLEDVTVESATATLHVREDGLVTLATYEYTVKHEDGVAKTSYSVSFSEFGETDVSSPAWVATARNETATHAALDSSPTDSRRPD